MSAIAVRRRAPLERVVCCAPGDAAAVPESLLPREWPCPLAATPQGAVGRVASLMPDERARVSRASAATEVLSSHHAARRPSSGGRRNIAGWEGEAAPEDGAVSRKPSSQASRLPLASCAASRGQAQRRGRWLMFLSVSPGSCPSRYSLFVVSLQSSDFTFWQIVFEAFGTLIHVFFSYELGWK